MSFTKGLLNNILPQIKMFKLMLQAYPEKYEWEKPNEQGGKMCDL